MSDLEFPSRLPNGAGDDDGHWKAVEDAAAQVLLSVQPTLASERKRAAVISYVRRLLGCSLGCQVLPYGSVPLKTYLPDGDIDLTVLANPTAEDALISDIHDVLKRQEWNRHAEFEVKAVQLISAEVKLVKCLIQDIIVDISCNQLGGLCTLCFLEQIDRLIEKDHLFKRSIILIKAWCFYESRILGATHGLFSTYALEVLVLYIFHIDHSSLKGPASVLYRFLDYFSKFDWDNYCISLDGPVCKSSLPDITVHSPEVARDGLLLSKQFLTNSTSMFKVPPRDLGKEPRPFQQKYINIIDPLKDDNNLGRSVNQGNFYRIRSAMRFGARKLGEILPLPTQSIRKELNRLFVNTLVTHRGRHQVSPRSSESSYSSSFQSSDVDSSIGVRSPTGEIEGSSDSSSQASDTSSYHADRSIQSVHLLDNPLESPKLGATVCDNGLPNYLCAKEVGADKCGEADSAGMCEELKGSDIIREPMGNIRNVSDSLPLSNHHGDNIHPVTSGPKWSTARVSSRHQSWNLIDHNEVSEPLDPCSGLAGDYERHLKSLYYGQTFHGNATTLPMFYNLPAWDIHHQMLNFGQDQMKPNQAVCGQPFRQVRGTGTYIPRTYPRTDIESWREERLPVKRGRRKQGRSPTFQSYHHDHNFGHGMIPVQANVTDQVYRQAELLKSRESTEDPSPLYTACNLSEGLEFSSSENLPEEKEEVVDERVSDDSLESESHPISPISPAAPIPDQNLPDTEKSKERVEEQPYELKDDDDFPPLAPQMPIRRSSSA